MKGTIDNPSRILVLGDSITEGDGSSDGKGWAGILREKYWQENIWLTNLGISGDTSHDLLERLEFLDSYRPDRIILAIGMNDSCIATKVSSLPISSVEKFEENLRNIIHKCSKYSQEIRLIGLTNVDEKKTSPLSSSTTGKTYTNDLIKGYDNKVEKVAKDYGFRYISPFGLLDQTDLIDGLHPTDAGYKKMANFLEDFIVGD